MTIESRRVKETQKEGKGSKRVVNRKYRHIDGEGNIFFSFLGGGGCEIGSKSRVLCLERKYHEKIFSLWSNNTSTSYTGKQCQCNQCCGSGSSNGMLIRIQLLKHQRQKHKNTTISKVLNEQIQFISMFLLFTIMCIQ